MEQQISLESVSELSVETLQRLEAAQAGFPLARYEIRPQLIRKVKLLALIYLVLSITATLAALVLFLIVLYQLLVLSHQHPIDPWNASATGTTLRHTNPAPDGSSFFASRLYVEHSSNLGAENAQA